MKEPMGWFVHLKEIHSDLHPCTQKDTAFSFDSLHCLFFVSTDGFEQHPPDTNEHKVIFFLSVWSDAVFFFHSVLLVCSPSLPIFRKDLFPNITNDKKILRDVLNIWKKNYFQFCYWLWRSTLKLLQGLFIYMEERIKINDGFLKYFDDKFIGKCEYGNGHHLCLSKQWRQ